MSPLEPQTIYRKNYQAPAYLVDKVELIFDLAGTGTRVESRLEIRRNQGVSEAEPLVLDGEDLRLLQVELDGVSVDAGSYNLNERGLTLSALPAEFVLRLVNEIDPAANTKLEGLYQSNAKFCTQCEAQGFRRITYFPDRPDVMSTYDVLIRADKATNPVLLCNGNLVDHGDLDQGRHFTRWRDPFPKPSYLFALVAGDLDVLSDSFETASGRQVDLHIYCDKGNAASCAYAMDSLKRSMAWDEEVFGLEYDLDIFNIVAVDDFNMGAMENKSLNVFNSKYILADPDTATDGDYAGIEAVVAHEYFHNWTGNRVTCRDWFQLSLKEGLTVFRDQQFSADMRSPAVKRIEDVRTLRAAQFPEDAGPLAHPIRPDSYMEINNFYTATVYEKGAEVIRMQHTLLGDAGFRKGMDLYFQRQDGQAVTCDDFVAAMADANDADLTQFKNWYGNAGTPTLKATGSFDQSQGRYSLTLAQATEPTPGQADKPAMHIPLRVGLLDASGADAIPEQLLQLTEASQQFHFDGLTTAPTPSLNRGFSAPIKIEIEDEAPASLAFQMAHDSDLFNRWEAGQKLASGLILEMVADANVPVNDAFLAAFGDLIEDDSDPEFLAIAMTLPGESIIAQAMDVVDVDGIHRAREAVRATLANAHESRLGELIAKHQSSDAYSPDARQAGARALKNASLALWAAGKSEAALAHCQAQYQTADNMSDRMAALQVLNNLQDDRRAGALAQFYQRYRDNSLVVDKWLALQATSTLPGSLQEVKALTEHPAFSIKQPNKVRALIGAFASSNPVNFHRTDGAGYEFLADMVLQLDPLNPQIGARLLTPLGRWRRFDHDRQEKMQAALNRVLGKKGLSRDIFEIASKSLD